jgi:hypothetical protein
MNQMREEPQQSSNKPDIDAHAHQAREVWQTPAVTEISRFDIMSLGPTPGTTENSTFSDKSG